MIPLKAVAALALSGLGAASMANVAYLEYGKHTPDAAQPAPAAAAPHRLIPKSEAPPAAPAEPASRIVELDPVVVYARAAPHIARHPKAEKSEKRLVACTQWRPLESGPVGRGVRVLCVQ